MGDCAVRSRIRRRGPSRRLWTRCSLRGGAGLYTNWRARINTGDAQLEERVRFFFRLVRRRVGRIASPANTAHNLISRGQGGAVGPVSAKLWANGGRNRSGSGQGLHSWEPAGIRDQLGATGRAEMLRIYLRETTRPSVWLDGFLTLLAEATGGTSRKHPLRKNRGDGVILCNLANSDEYQSRL